MDRQEILLRKLRGHLAYSKQCKPYCIFRDIELNMLLRVKPLTLEDLSKIKGFPKEGARLNNYGEAIIQIFKDCSTIEDFEVSLNKEGEPCARVMRRSSAF